MFSGFSCLNSVKNFGKNKYLSTFARSFKTSHSLHIKRQNISAKKHTRGVVPSHYSATLVSIKDSNLMKLAPKLHINLAKAHSQPIVGHQSTGYIFAIHAALQLGAESSQHNSSKMRPPTQRRKYSRYICFASSFDSISKRSGLNLETWRLS